MSFIAKYWKIVIACLLLILAIFFIYNYSDKLPETEVTIPNDLIVNESTVVDKNVIEPIKSNEEVENNGFESQETDAISEDLIVLPTTFDQKVLFASQAPFGDWSLPYQEACEEASLIIVDHYFRNKLLTSEIMDQEIKKLVAWETERFGLYSDTSIDEVAIMAEEYFGLKAKKINDITVDVIKQELVAGQLIIAPFAGRELGNKFFTAPGPIYHMLVIKGYDRNEFITNDVGTRHGADFKYKYSTLINAIHDLPLTTEGVPYRPYDVDDLDEVKQATMLTGGKALLSLSL